MSRDHLKRGFAPMHDFGMKAVKAFSFNDRQNKKHVLDSEQNSKLSLQNKPSMMPSGSY